MRRRYILCAVLVAALAAPNLRVQFQYLWQTQRANQHSAIMVERLSQAARLAPDQPIVLDVPETGMTGLVATFTRGHPTVALASQGMWSVSPQLAAWTPVLFARRHAEEIIRLSRIMREDHRPLRFDLAPHAPAVHQFFRYAGDEAVTPGSGMLVSGAADRTVLNSLAGLPAIGFYYLRPMIEVRNHLSLMDTDLGHMTIPGVIEDIALWSREGDFASGGSGIQAIGRHLLFEVLNPVPGSRLLFDFTSGPLAAEQGSLPAAFAVGEHDKVGFDFVGSGAGRLLSEQITPRRIEGRYYIAVDMAAEPRRMKTPMRGLAGAYNRHLHLDPRRIVGWTRGLSLVTDEQSRAMTPPSSVKSFPVDLFQPGLLFSGVYEDGWMAERARFWLASQNEASTVRIVGHAPGSKPLLADASIEILVDGVSVAQQKAGRGDFTLTAAIAPATGPRWIELRVDFAEPLSPADRRIASLLLKSIALE